jgi:hypothetical protein
MVYKSAYNFREHHLACLMPPGECPSFAAFRAALSRILMRKSKAKGSPPEQSDDQTNPQWLYGVP